MNLIKHERELQKNRELYRFLTDLFEPEDFKDFLEATYKKLPLTIRLNNLKNEPGKTLESLKSQGFEFKEVPEIPWAYRVLKEPFSIGKTLEHFLGFFYIQELASMLPPLILMPEPGETVLDIAAAPGSKTTQMAQMMQNKGVIVANDVDVKRLKALTHNLDKLGVLNVIVTLSEGYVFGFRFKEIFDKVLVDVPCSALGTLHRTYEILNWWSWQKVKRLVRTQKGLILAAYKALKKGGKMVYSTCTLVPDENEGIVDFLLQRFPEAKVLKVPEIKNFKMRPGLTHWHGHKFNEEVKNTVRIYPQDNLTEGFYIAYIEKPS